MSMKRQPQIKINQFQLAILLNDKEKQNYRYLIEEGVFCIRCLDTAICGIVVEEIFLNDLNDIYVRGTCTICNGKVGRIMEFGEDKAFYERANIFRKAIHIL